MKAVQAGSAKHCSAQSSQLVAVVCSVTFSMAVLQRTSIWTDSSRIVTALQSVGATSVAQIELLDVVVVATKTEKPVEMLAMGVLRTLFEALVTVKKPGIAVFVPAAVGLILLFTLESDTTRSNESLTADDPELNLLFVVELNTTESDEWLAATTPMIIVLFKSLEFVGAIIEAFDADQFAVVVLVKFEATYTDELLAGTTPGMIVLFKAPVFVGASIEAVHADQFAVVVLVEFDETYSDELVAA